MTSIRRMNTDDIDAAVEIERVCFSKPWSRNVYNATLLLPYAHYYVAEAEGRVVGTIGVQFVGGDGEISNVAVLPQYRRQGIASSMLSYVLTYTKNMGNGDYTLEVREGNTAAVALYSGFGFVTEGVRRDYYDDPRDNALIMWRRRGVGAG